MPIVDEEVDEPDVPIVDGDEMLGAQQLEIDGESELEFPVVEFPVAVEVPAALASAPLPLDLHEALGAIDDHPADDLPTVPLTFWSIADSQVRVRATDEIIGRVKMIREGLPTECVSVYCRLHGCTVPLKRTRQSPNIESLLGWFQAGSR